MARLSLPFLKTKLIRLRQKLPRLLSGYFDQLLWRLSGKMPDPRPDGQVIFACELLQARAVRIAMALRQEGQPVHLFCLNTGFVKEFEAGEFASVTLFRNKWHLLRLLRKRSIRLVHAFAPPSEALALLKTETCFPLLLDMQDVLVTYHGLTPPYAWARRELQFERQLFAHCDGLVAHSLEPREGFRLYGQTTRPPVLFFPLLCDETAFITRPKISGEELHLVYAGGVAGSHRDRKQFGILQFFSLIEEVTRQGMHFHLYPSPTTLQPDWEEYAALARTNPKFHFHEPVANNLLAGELAKYHFGILPFFREDSDLRPEKMRNATALKLFNFFEAGLPVIISADLRFQAWMVTRGQAGIAIRKTDVPTLRQRLESMHYADWQAQVEAHRHALSLQQQLPRLQAFYKLIAP